MWHVLVITLHAIAGVVALVAGAVVVRQRSFFPLYFWSLVALVVFLAVVIAIDWQDLDTATRAFYCALLVLGGYMIRRGIQARGLVRARSPQQRVRFTDHVGFTLISLFVGFVVVAALDLGAPGWIAVAAAAVAIVVGRFGIARFNAEDGAMVRAPVSSPPPSIS